MKGGGDKRIEQKRKEEKKEEQRERGEIDVDAFILRGRRNAPP